MATTANFITEFKNSGSTTRKNMVKSKQQIIYTEDIRKNIIRTNCF